MEEVIGDRIIFLNRCLGLWSENDLELLRSEHLENAA
jgi:hypothetical protein